MKNSRPPNLTPEEKEIILHGEPINHVCAKDYAAGIAQATKPLGTMNVSDDIVALRRRKAELEEKMRLQEEIQEMERRLMLGTGREVERTVCEVVAEHFHVTMPMLNGRSRMAAIVAPRMICYYLMRSLCPNATLATIGKIFQKHHGAVVSGSRNIAGRIETEPKFADEIATIKSKVLARMAAQSEAK